MQITCKPYFAATEPIIKYFFFLSMMKCSRYEIISIFWMWYTHTTYKSDLAESCKIHFEKSLQNKDRKNRRPD